jgi:hypothetical protein
MSHPETELEDRSPPMVKIKVTRVLHDTTSWVVIRTRHTGLSVYLSKDRLGKGGVVHYF